MDVLLSDFELTLFDPRATGSSWKKPVKASESRAIAKKAPEKLHLCWSFSNLLFFWLQDIVEPVPPEEVHPPAPTEEAHHVFPNHHWLSHLKSSQTWPGDCRSLFDIHCFFLANWNSWVRWRDPVKVLRLCAYNNISGNCFHRFGASPGQENQAGLAWPKLETSSANKG